MSWLRLATNVLNGGFVSVVAVVIHEIWWKDTRRSLNDDDFPAFHHVLVGGVVDAIGRAAGAEAI